MPLWLQMSRNYSNPESVNYKIAYLREQLNKDLGKLAYEDQVQLAMLGETIIVGGYLRTELIAANSIVGDKIASNAIATRHIQADAITADKIAAQSITADTLNVQTLSAISANLGEVTSGSLNIGNGAFKVSSAGKLEATGADITGKITATSGSFPASLITGALTANQINVSTLSAISANLGTITAGILRSSNGQSYFDLNNNKIKTNNAEITGGTINIDTISELSNIIQLNGGGHTLYLAPGLIEMSFGSNQETQIGPGNALIGDILLSADEILFFSNSQLTHTDIGAHYISTYTLTADALMVTGSKNRIIKTENFDKVLHYCLESPTPYFMDIGHGVIGYDGICYIDIEQIFSETVDLVSDYHVQLTRYGPGDIWVAEKDNSHFIVEGTPGLRFAWEIKAKQKGYSNERLEKYERLEYEEEVDYGTLGYEYMIEYEKELIA